MKTETIERWSPSALLALLFLFQGAKSPVFFAFWALLALGWSGWIFYRHKLSLMEQAGHAVALVVLVMLQMYSVDSNISFYWTCQYAVMITAGLALYRMPQRNDDTFWRVLSIMGVTSALLTSYQLFRQSPSYGFLPLNPNFNAVWLACLSTGLLLRPQRSRHELFLAGWMSALVILGCSRSGLCALTIGALYFSHRRYAIWKVAAGFLAIAAFISMTFAPWIQEQIHSVQRDARLEIWTVAWKAFLERPWTGWGAGTFELAYLKYQFPTLGPVRYGYVTLFAHNDFLQLLSEMGGIFTGFIAAIVLFLAGHKTTEAERPYRGMLYAFAAASLFNTFFKLPLFLYFAAYLLMHLRKPAAVRTPRSIPWPSLLLLAGLSAAVFWSGLRSHWMKQSQWEQILRWDSTDSEALHQLAYRTKDPVVALSLHRKAAESSPRNLYMVEALARTLESLPQKEVLPEAHSAFLRAVQLAPARATNYLSLVRLFWRNGEPTLSLQWAQRAELLEPNYFEASLWHARALAALHEPRKAADVLTQLQKRYASLNLTPADLRKSAYANVILQYDESVVRQDLSKYRVQ